MLGFQKLFSRCQICVKSHHRPLSWNAHVQALDKEPKKFDAKFFRCVTIKSQGQPPIGSLAYISGLIGGFFFPLRNRFVRISCRSHHTTTPRDLWHTRCRNDWGCRRLGKIPGRRKLRSEWLPLPCVLSKLDRFESGCPAGPLYPAPLAAVYGPASPTWIPICWWPQPRHESLLIRGGLLATGVQLRPSEKATPLVDHCFADPLPSLPWERDRRVILPEIAHWRLPAITKVRKIRSYSCSWTVMNTFPPFHFIPSKFNLNSRRTLLGIAAYRTIVDPKIWQGLTANTLPGELFIILLSEAFQWKEVHAICHLIANWPLYYLRIFDVIPLEENVGGTYLTSPLEGPGSTTLLDWLIISFLHQKPGGHLKVVDMTGFEHGMKWLGLGRWGQSQNPYLHECSGSGAKLVA